MYFKPVDPPIHDQLITLCHLIKEDQFDRTIIQSCHLIAQTANAKRVALFLVNYSGTEIELVADVKPGDTHWASKNCSFPILQKGRLICPLSQAILTGKTIELKNNGAGYNLDNICFVFQNYNSLNGIKIYPLLSKDKTLGLIAIDCNAYSQNSLENAHGKLILDTVSSLISERKKILAVHSQKNELSRSYVHAQKEREHLLKHRNSDLSHRIIGRSEAITELRAKILSLADSQQPIMIIGKSGEGKEEIAKELHQQSSARSNKFIYVNCSTLNIDNFATELFGWKRGAIKGVASSYKGLIREAAYGTVYFDRIDLLPKDLWPIMSRLVSNCEIRAIGSNQNIKVKVRLIFSSDAEACLNLASEDQVRFFNEIAQITLTIPSLLKRIEDIEPICEFAVNQFNERERTSLKAEKDTIKYLINTKADSTKRELIAYIQKACRFVGKTETLKKIHFQKLEMEYSQYTAETNTAHKTLREAVEDFECATIKNAMAENDWDRFKVSKILGLPKRTLADKCLKYGLS